MSKILKGCKPKNDKEVLNWAITYSKKVVPDDPKYAKLVEIARKSIINTIYDTANWIRYD